MKKLLSVVICLLLCSGSPTARLASAAVPSKGKNDKKVALLPHAQVSQDTIDAAGKHNDKGFVVRQWDGSLYMEASLFYWEGEDRTVSLVLAIQYPTGGPENPLVAPKPPQLLFVPSTIIVVLPNGHSYRPYNKADVLQQAYAMENARTANAYSGYNPPPVTTYNTNCSLNGDTASCRTTADQSTQVGYAVGYALGATISNAFARHKAQKYIKQVKEVYLESQQIPLGATVLGYVDLYVEDVHAGPFTVRVPAGDKVYDFVFGPEVTTIEIPKEN